MLTDFRQYVFKMLKLYEVTCFFANNRCFNVFYRFSSNRGRKGKNCLLGLRQILFTKIGYVGVRFAQKGSKIEDRFTGIFWFPCECYVFYLELYFVRSLHSVTLRFAAKRKMIEVISSQCSHLFSLILTLLYRTYIGIRG